jgi:hypothetical protein
MSFRERPRHPASYPNGLTFYMDDEQMNQSIAPNTLEEQNGN